MKTVSTVVLALLVLLAISSGITKMLLMPQDVAFFGQYGFSHPILVAFGITQLAGGIALVFKKTRFAGAVIVAATFLVSLVLLVMDGNIPVSIVTAVATLLLGVVAKQHWKVTSVE